MSVENTQSGDHCVHCGALGAPHANPEACSRAADRDRKRVAYRRYLQLCRAAGKAAADRIVDQLGLPPAPEFFDSRQLLLFGADGRPEGGRP